MEPITSQEYFAECASIAREAVRDAEGDRDNALERCDEDTDQHQWIMYTYYHTQILQHSSHDNAYFEDFGPLTADSYSEATQMMAIAAFRRDVYEYLDTALEEWVSDDDIESLAQDCATRAYEAGATAPWGTGEPLPQSAVDQLQALVSEPTAAQRKLFESAFREHHTDTIEANA